jgi:GlpG protein
MRHIGNLPDEKHARVFGDFLVAGGIRNELEREEDGSWVVWIAEEDHLPEAQAAFERFRANPGAPEFQGATTSAAKVREAEAEDLKAYRKRIRTRQSLFRSFGRQGVGILTYSLIFACCTVGYFSDMGTNDDFLQHWFISNFLRSSMGFLPEVLSGEVWRLFTPIFVHLDIIHLLFNMMWLFQLGCMIEARQSSWHLLALVAVIALVSNLAQYYFHHPFFGGMSGAVYGLAGYVWIRGKYDPGSGVFLDQISLIILMVGLVGCYAGFFGPVANTAHLVGLISGAVWGGVSAFWALRNPK